MILKVLNYENKVLKKNIKIIKYDWEFEINGYLFNEISNDNNLPDNFEEGCILYIL